MALADVNTAQCTQVVTSLAATIICWLLLIFQLAAACSAVHAYKAFSSESPRVCLCRATNENVRT